MPRVRTTKALAKRIDLSYFKKPHPFRAARRVLIVAVCIGALAWWGVSYLRGREMMYNPGPVALVHAMWSNDCGVCHDPHKSGRFSKSVSDESCLQCHDGAIHHANQVTLIGIGSDGRQHAARCAACHIEHRGHEALMASSDAFCTRCHADLANHDAKPHELVLQTAVTRFDSSHHPQFGRLLPTTNPSNRESVWYDTTPLAFNHAKHMPMEQIKARCDLCHNPMALQPIATHPTGQAISPPFLTDRDLAFQGHDHPLRPPPWPSDVAGSFGQRYMQPVSYARHCASCHTMKLKAMDPDYKPTVADNEVLLPHADLEIVRRAIEHELSVGLTAAPDGFKGPGKKASAGGAPRIPGRKPPAESSGPATIKKAEWLRHNAQFILHSINNDRSSTFPAFTGTIPDESAISDTAELSDPQFVDLYTAWVALNQCNECHHISGSFPALTSDASSQAGQSLSTLPTGIPSGIPRRWFVNSRFDHGSHRNLMCTACHFKAPTSEKTTDVLLPERGMCIQCHHPTKEANAGASVSCITCHNFHDRTKERSLPGNMTIAEALPRRYRGSSGRETPGSNAMAAPNPTSGPAEGGR